MMTEELQARAWRMGYDQGRHGVLPFEVFSSMMREASDGNIYGRVLRMFRRGKWCGIRRKEKGKANVEKVPQTALTSQARFQLLAHANGLHNPDNPSEAGRGHRAAQTA